MYHARLQHMVMRQGEARRQAGSWPVGGGKSQLMVWDDRCFAESDGDHGKDSVHHAEDLPDPSVPTFRCDSADNTQLECTMFDCQLSPEHSGQLDGCTHQWLRPASLGLVMTPSHTYGRGKLYKQQELSHKLLVQNNLNIDGAFCLPFKQRMDDATRGRSSNHDVLF